MADQKESKKAARRKSVVEKFVLDELQRQMAVIREKQEEVLDRLNELGDLLFQEATRAGAAARSFELKSKAPGKKVVTKRMAKLPAKRLPNVVTKKMAKVPAKGLPTVKAKKASGTTMSFDGLGKIRPKPPGK